jgi:prepilin-type N-terminal cleavage/methylation domain-containing protein
VTGDCVKKNIGFTIVELLVVIVVIGILATILVPIFSGFISSSGYKAAQASADNYVYGVNVKAAAPDSDEDFSNGNYYVNKNSDANGNRLPKVNAKNSLPAGENDYVVLDDSKVIEYELTFNNYLVSLKDGEKSVTQISYAGTIDTPVFNINGLNITVTSSIENVSKFNVYADNNKIGEFVSNLNNIDVHSLAGYNLTNGTTYNITLKAISSNPSYKSSEISSAVSFKAYTLVKTMIYENGNQYPTVTGGWTNNVGLRNGNWYSYPAVFNPDHVLLIEGNNYGLWAQSAIRTQTMINYHDYTTLGVNYEISGPIDYAFLAQMSTSTSMDYSAFFMFEEAKAHLTPGNYSKEVSLSSAYNGNAYLKILLFTGMERPSTSYDNLKIHNIYLLKKIDY